MNSASSGGKRAVLFDAGNTLLHLDTDKIVEKLAPLGWKIPPEDLGRGEKLARPFVSKYIDEGRSTEGKDVRHFYVKTTLEQAGTSPPMGMPLDFVVGMIVGYLLTPRGVDKYWTRVEPGTREALERLAADGWTLGVVSNSDGQIERRLNEAGFNDLFEVVVDSGAVGVEKPDRRIFEIALEKLGIDAANATYVGDLFHVDVVGARSAGMNAALVDPLDAQVEFDCPRVPSVIELHRILSEVSGR